MKIPLPLHFVSEEQNQFIVLICILIEATVKVSLQCLEIVLYGMCYNAIEFIKTFPRVMLRKVTRPVKYLGKLLTLNRLYSGLNKGHEQISKL